MYEYTQTSVPRKSTLISKQNIGTLTPQLWQRGWSLPDLGGIDHQTVGGFLSTGSSGGFAPAQDQFTLDSAIQSIRFVDGQGVVHTVYKGTDEFNAVGVSVGLLGIITEVTIQCVEQFNIVGTEETAEVAGNKIVNLTYDSNLADCTFFIQL